MYLKHWCLYFSEWNELLGLHKTLLKKYKKKVPSLFHEMDHLFPHKSLFSSFLGYNSHNPTTLIPQVLKYVTFVLNNTTKNNPEMRAFTLFDFPHRYAYTNDTQMLSQCYSESLITPDRGGASALHYACAQGSAEACRYLLDLKVITNTKDSCGYTPIDIARHFGHTHLFDLFDEAISAGSRKISPLIQYSSRIHERKILIIYNPVSGRGNAERVCFEIAAPILSLAGAKVEIRTTRYSGHATKIATSLKEDDFDCVLIAGGDGSVFDFLNGVDDLKFPIGQIPSGSGNAIAANMGWFNSFEACRCLADGQFMAFDLFHLKQPFGGKVDEYYAAVLVGWGFLSDVDFNSEFMRCLGDSRFDIYALAQIISKKKYPCILEYHLWEEAPSDCLNPNVNQDGIERVFGNGWHCIENSNVNFFAFMNGPGISESSIIAKNASLNDGKIWLGLAQNQRILDMISLMAKLSDGRFVNSDDVFIIPVDQFVIRPCPNGPPIDIDGERFPVAPIYAKVLPGMARFAC